MLAVASIPAAHPYVRALVDPECVALLDDPTPLQVTVPDQWWPPRWLEPAYLTEHLTTVDVLHLHFGMDTISPQTLSEVADILCTNRIPLVVTVHDIDNPHFTDQRDHHRRLETVLARADAVVTLTHGAAAEIARRWGRTAAVHAHPQVLPTADVGRSRKRLAHPVIALHAKGLRANIDPWPVLEALLATGWSGIRLDVDLAAFDHPRGADLDDRLHRYRRAGVDVRVHPPFTDAELVEYLYAVDVLVLPYRFGTHSGWVEACRDSRVVPVVPDCGFFDEQTPCETYGFGLGRFDPASLVQAVARACGRVRARPSAADAALSAGRCEQRAAVRAQTAALYRRVLAGAAAA